MGAATKYRIAFYPETFVEGMVVQLKFPEQIQVVPGVPFECESLSSNVDETIDCQYYAAQQSIIISNAFNTKLYDSSQGLVFSVGLLKNPETLQITDSFYVRTITEDGFPIDFQDEDMTIEFKCLLPCASCSVGTNNECTSCHTDGILTNKPVLH